MAELLPGPASMAGLAWLVRVGPAPLDAWRSAMGWCSSVAGSHARRLERQGWLERHRMTRGKGSLLVATRRGVRMSGLAVGARGGAGADVVGPRLRVRLDGRLAVGPRTRVARPTRGARRPRVEGRARMADRDGLAPERPPPGSRRRDGDRDGRDRGRAPTQGRQAPARNPRPLRPVADRAPDHRTDLRVPERRRRRRGSARWVRRPGYPTARYGSSCSAPCKPKRWEGRRDLARGKPGRLLAVRRARRRRRLAAAHGARPSRRGTSTCSAARPRCCAGSRSWLVGGTRCSSSRRWPPARRPARSSRGDGGWPTWAPARSSASTS